MSRIRGIDIEREEKMSDELKEDCQCEIAFQQARFQCWSICIMTFIVSVYFLANNAINKVTANTRSMIEAGYSQEQQAGNTGIMWVLHEQTMKEEK
jgi:ABC-type phosphate transport system permease subunit